MGALKMDRLMGRVYEQLAVNSQVFHQEGISLYNMKLRLRPQLHKRYLLCLLTKLR